MKYLLSFVILATLFNSCTDQNAKSEYNLKAVELNDKALKYALVSKNDSALLFYDKAIKLDETYYLPHANKISIYLSRKQFDLAIQESEMVIKIKPDLAEGWVLAGMLYDRQEDLTKATKYYEKSIALFGDKIENSDKMEMIFSYKLNRAMAYVLLDQEEKGKTELRLLKQEEPENSMIDELLNMSKEEYMNKLFDE